jgi:hypothetical protein
LEEEKKAAEKKEAVAQQEETPKKPILPYSSMFIFGTENPYVIILPDFYLRFNFRLFT